MAADPVLATNSSIESGVDDVNHAFQKGSQILLKEHSESNPVSFTSFGSYDIVFQEVRQYLLERGVHAGMVDSYAQAITDKARKHAEEQLGNSNIIITSIGVGDRAPIQIGEGAISVLYHDGKSNQADFAGSSFVDVRNTISGTSMTSNCADVNAMFSKYGFYAVSETASKSTLKGMAQDAAIGMAADIAGGAMTPEQAELMAEKTEFLTTLEVEGEPLLSPDIAEAIIEPAQNIQEAISSGDLNAVQVASDAALSSLSSIIKTGDISPAQVTKIANNIVKTAEAATSQLTAQKMEAVSANNDNATPIIAHNDNASLSTTEHTQSIDMPAAETTTESAKVEAATAETPQSDAPKVEAATAEALTTEATTADSPKVETLTAEAVTTDGAKIEAAGGEAATADAPTAETVTEAPKTEAAAAEATTEATKVEASTDGAKIDTPTAETATADTPTAETVIETPQSDAPKVEAATAEVPTTEATTAEAPKIDAPAAIEQQSSQPISGQPETQQITPVQAVQQPQAQQQAPQSTQPAQAQPVAPQPNQPATQPAPQHPAVEAAQSQQQPTGQQLAPVQDTAQQQTTQPTQPETPKAETGPEEKQEMKFEKGCPSGCGCPNCASSFNDVSNNSNEPVVKQETALDLGQQQSQPVPNKPATQQTTPAQALQQPQAQQQAPQSTQPAQAQPVAPQPNQPITQPAPQNPAAETVQPQQPTGQQPAPVQDTAQQQPQQQTTQPTQPDTPKAETGPEEKQETKFEKGCPSGCGCPKCTSVYNDAAKNNSEPVVKQTVELDLSKQESISPIVEPTKPEINLLDNPEEQRTQQPVSACGRAGGCGGCTRCSAMFNVMAEMNKGLGDESLKPSSKPSSKLEANI